MVMIRRHRSRIPLLHQAQCRPPEPIHKQGQDGTRCAHHGSQDAMVREVFEVEGGPAGAVRSVSPQLLEGPLKAGKAKVGDAFDIPPPLN